MAQNSSHSNSEHFFNDIPEPFKQFVKETMNGTGSDSINNPGDNLQRPPEVSFYEKQEDMLFLLLMMLLFKEP